MELLFHVLTQVLIFIILQLVLTLRILLFPVLCPVLNLLNDITLIHILIWLIRKFFCDALLQEKFLSHIGGLLLLIPQNRGVEVCIF